MLHVSFLGYLFKILCDSGILWLIFCRFLSLFLVFAHFFKCLAFVGCCELIPEVNGVFHILARDPFLSFQGVPPAGLDVPLLGLSTVVHVAP